MLMEAHGHLTLYLGAWFVILDFENADWHVPINARCRHFVAIQMREHVFQLTVLPRGLYITSRVLTKMMKPVAWVLSHQGVEILETSTTGSSKHSTTFSLKLNSTSLCQ